MDRNRGVLAIAAVAALTLAGAGLALRDAPSPAGRVSAANPGSPTVDIGTPLPPLDLGGMALWNWSAKWHASQWANPNSPIPWRYDHVHQGANGAVVFTLDAGGAPQLQAVNATPAYRRGTWEADVTLPDLRDGLIVAPLWLYDPDSKDEIDFEYAGRGGLDVSMHVYVNGVHKQDTVRLFAGQNASGQRKRFTIALDEDAGTADMFVDGRRVHRWDRAKLPFFVTKALKPRIEMWAANPGDGGFVSWVGRWAGLQPAAVLTMTAHGYRYRP